MTRTRPPAADTSLRATFPALLHLLGDERFATLQGATVARAVEGSTHAAAVVHSLLVRNDELRPPDYPSRLGADVAALEYAIAEVDKRARAAGPVPRASAADLADLGSGWRQAVFEPLRAFELVPVAFRLDGWLRRARAGRAKLSLPARAPQHVAVFALRSGYPTAATPTIWWHGYDPEEGRLLAALALGMPLGEVIDAALAERTIDTIAAGRELAEGWLHEGLFSRVVSG